MLRNLRLIASPTSPFARKVRIVMAEKRIECEVDMTDVWSPDTYISQFNPLGKVPCLILDDGGAVFDSRVIVEYLDTLTPVGHLIPPSGRQRVEVRTWEALADGIVDALALVRLEHTQRPEQIRSQAWIDRQLGKVEAGLKAASTALAEKTWCHEERFTLADIALGVALGYLDYRFPEIAWRAKYPKLGRYYEKLATRQSFLDTAPPAA
ncbi:MAG TPA: glutathione S-transferase C-terminal domain-containing protein [Burkholderiaceae bacterium]|nr:glutathione S-transferase C-terminal domain-containing protein [Burkholderiaceae bacterium]